MKLKILANQKLWRQCRNCKHMIERSEGCIKLTCRFSSHSLAVITLKKNLIMFLSQLITL